MKLIVIDIQKGITDERLYDFAGFLKNVTSIIDAARKNSVEVIYVQHDDGPGTGFSIGDVDFEIADQVAPEAGEKIFVKEIIQLELLLSFLRCSSSVQYFFRALS